MKPMHETLHEMHETPEQWLRREFDRCREWIQAALDRDIGTHLIEDVWAMLESGNAQLWPLAHGVIVTATEIYPRKKILRAWLAGGDLEEILASEPPLRRWAGQNGFDIVGIVARRGWLRKLDGYSEVSAVIYRPCRD